MSGCLRWFVGALLVLVAVPGWSQSENGKIETGFVRRTFRDDAGDHRYVVFVPAGYKADRAWPVIIYLHSASERGNDGVLPTTIGLGPVIQERAATFPFLAVFPQCSDTATSVREAWGPQASSGRRALAILDEVLKTYRTDSDRVYLMGGSMGGFGVWSHAAADPGRWAAAVPLCGGGDPATGGKLRDLALWAFHGSDDRAVPPELSQKMIEAIKKAGGAPRYDELKGVGHDVWNIVLRRDDLYDWLLAQKRGQRPVEVARNGKPAAPGLLDDTAPFVPMINVPNAAYVRLGNRLLETIGHGLPELAPADVLQGSMGDQNTMTQTQAGPMSVSFRGLKFRGKLGYADLQARADGLLAVTLRAHRVTLSIDSTTVQGSGRYAECGPIRIVIGQREPVKLRATLRPSTEGGRLKLVAVNTDFRISTNDMDVIGPEWVNASGLGMTSERVSSGLRNGFYSDTSRFEQSVVESLPRMLDRLTENLPLKQADQLVGSLWPLPVYKPRVKTWPSAVQVDGQGISLSLGVSIGAVRSDQVKGQPARVVLPDTDFRTADPTADFRFAISPSLFEHLSRPLVDADVARVLVIDSPLTELMPLAQPERLQTMIPDLAKRKVAQVRSELALREPMKLNRLTDGGKELVELQLSQVRCEVAIPGEKPDSWQPYFNVRFNVKHRATAELLQATYATRALSLHWQGDAAIDVDADFADGMKPSDKNIARDKLRDIVVGAWREWTTTGPLAKTMLPDLTFGLNCFRAEQMAVGPFLATTFLPAGIHLRNAGDAKLAYEAKSLISPWGGPYDLQPTKEHPYPVAHPFTIRFNSAGQQKTYTLAPGYRFEFRAQKGGGVELFTLPDRSREETVPASKPTEVSTEK